MTGADLEATFAAHSMNAETEQHSCLPRACDTYAVKHSGTCHSIRKTQQLGIGKLASFNPTINKGCTDLVVGDSICLSPLVGYAKPKGVPNEPKAASMGVMNKQSISSTETVKTYPAMIAAKELVPCLWRCLQASLNNARNLPCQNQAVLARDSPKRTE